MTIKPWWSSKPDGIGFESGLGNSPFEMDRSSFHGENIFLFSFKKKI